MLKEMVIPFTTDTNGDAVVEENGVAQELVGGIVLRDARPG